MPSKDTGQFGILSGVYCMYLSTRRGAGVMNATEDIHGHVGAIIVNSLSSDIDRRS